MEQRDTMISINCITNNQEKYIAFCEGDDYWTNPYKLQKQVEFRYCGILLFFKQYRWLRLLGKDRSCN